MPRTEAQRRAKQNYEKRSVRQFSLKFSPPEHDLLDWLKSQPEPTATLIKDACRALRDSRENGLTSKTGTGILISDRKEGAVRKVDLECEYLMRDERAFLEALLAEPDGLAARRKAEARLALISSVVDGWDEGASRQVGSKTNEPQLNDVHNVGEEGSAEQ